METAIFIGKFDCKLLQSDGRRISAVPASIAVNMPFSHFKEKDCIYLVMGCTLDIRILDLLVFCRTIGTTVIAVFESPPADVDAILERGIILYMTKQPKWFLRKVGIKSKGNLFESPGTIIRYDSVSNTITSKEL